MEKKLNREAIVASARDARERTIRRLELVPNGFMNWRINGSALSFAHIAQHIVKVDELFFNLLEKSAKQYTWKMGTDEEHEEFDEEACALLMEKLQESGEQRERMLAKLSDADLLEKVQDEHGEEVTLEQFILINVIGHEVYHRGQLSVFLKILKGEPGQHATTHHE